MYNHSSESNPLCADNHTRVLSLPGRDFLTGFAVSVPHNQDLKLAYPFALLYISNRDFTHALNLPAQSEKCLFFKGVGLFLAFPHGRDSLLNPVVIPAPSSLPVVGKKALISYQSLGWHSPSLLSIRSWFDKLSTSAASPITTLSFPSR